MSAFFPDPVSIESNDEASARERDRYATEQSHRTLQCHARDHLFSE